MVTAALSFIPNCTSPSGVFAADIFAMLSLFARADIAPAITYIVSMVFSSKNARSAIASLLRAQNFGKPVCKVGKGSR